MLEDVTKEPEKEEDIYADSLMSTMQTLLSELEGNKAQDSHDSDGKSWARIKAISSAISREAPTISGDVNTDFLAPLPNIRISGNLQHQMENLQKKRDARKSAIPSIPE